MSTKSKLLKPLKEVRSCPLYCQTKGTPRCNRLSCLILNEYLITNPCKSCPQKNKKFCPPDCLKVTQWNSAWHWREDVGWDSKYRRFPIPDLEENVTVSPENKIPKDALMKIRENLILEEPTKTAPRYARVTEGGKVRFFRHFTIKDPDVDNWLELNFKIIDNKIIKKLPANAVIISDEIHREGYPVDSLIDKASEKVAEKYSIPYEDALMLVYKTSRPCKNSNCPSRIPHPRFRVSIRTQFCSEACRKSYRRSKV